MRMAELEKLGPKYRITLRIARDERWERLQCSHKQTYADDCLVDRVIKHKIYIVATNDRDLKRRVRKVCFALFCRGFDMAVETKGEGWNGIGKKMG